MADTIEDVQAAIVDGLEGVKAGLEAQVAEAVKKYEGQVAESGKAASEVKDEVKALSEQFAKQAAAIKELTDKATGALAPEAKNENDPGAAMIESAEFKAVVDGKMPKARIQVKAINPVISDPASTVYQQQKPGVVPGPFLPLTVRAILPSATASSPLIVGTRESAFTNSAAGVAQGAAKPQSDVQFSRYNVTIETIAHYIKVSSQLIQDAPAIRSYINRRLRYGLDKVIDDQLMNGTGVAPNLSGLLLAANYTAFTPATGANLAESINKAKYALYTAGYHADAVIVNPSDWGAMETLKSSGSGEYLWGAPGLALGMNPFGVRVVLSPAMPAGKFLVGGFQEATMLWQRQGDTIEVGYDGSDFTQNLLTIRAETRLGLEVNQPAALLGGAFTA